MSDCLYDLSMSHTRKHWGNQIANLECQVWDVSYLVSGGGKGGVGHVTSLETVSYSSNTSLMLCCSVCGSYEETPQKCSLILIAKYGKVLFLWFRLTGIPYYCFISVTTAQ